MYMVFMPLCMIEFWQVRIFCGRHMHVNWFTCKPVEKCFLCPEKNNKHVCIFKA